MNSKRKRWSEDEDRVVLDQVRRNASNLTYAFEKASELLEGRTKQACSMRWYMVLAKRPETNICFATVSNDSQIVNKKRLTKKEIESQESESEDTTVVTSWWNRLLNLFR